LRDDDFQPGACRKISQAHSADPRVAVWDETEVDAWMSEQMAKALQPARVPESHKRTSATVAASMPLSYQLTLSEAYALCATRSDFDRKLVQFMARHGKRGALVQRLADAGLWKKSSR